MLLNIVVCVYPALLLLPIVLYFVSVRPKFHKSTWPLYLTAGVMVLSAFLPLAGMAHMSFLILWVVTTGVLLLASAAVWMYGAVKNKQVYLTGPVMTGVTVMASGALIGNWLSVIMALIFLAVLARYRTELSAN